MSVASLPSPSRALWHLGPVPIRAYAICVILGVLAGLLIADRRYRRIGGRAGLILDVATLAVPFGLVGARGYSVITDYQLYIGHGHDWTAMLRIWDGRIGIPGAVAAGAAGAWIACRRAGVAFGPVAGAAAPGLAFGQAIGRSASRCTAARRRCRGVSRSPRNIVSGVTRTLPSSSRRSSTSPSGTCLSACW